MARLGVSIKGLSVARDRSQCEYMPMGCSAVYIEVSKKKHKRNHDTISRFLGVYLEARRRIQMLVVTHEVNTALRYAATHNSALEVGGFGRTHLSENGLDVVVDEIYIPPQVVQAGHTNIKGPHEEGGDGMLEEAMRYFATHCKHCRHSWEDHEGQDHGFEGEAWTDWRLWWHSHGKMGVTPSHTDTSTLAGHARLLDGWAVGLVIDASGGRHAWAAVSVPFKKEFDIEFGYYPYEDPVIRERVAALMEHVQERKWEPQSYGYRGPNQGNGKSGGAKGKIPLLSRRKNNKPIMAMTDEEFKEWMREEGYEAVELGSGD